MTAPEVFACRRCGECCRGRGGIRLTGEQLARAAVWLRLTEAEFKGRFLARASAGPPWEAGVGEDGWCALNRNGRCLIHPVKPLVCRAWPFLRGPLRDESAFYEARAACPGLAACPDWPAFQADFARTGRAFPPQRWS